MCALSSEEFSIQLHVCSNLINQWVCQIEWLRIDHACLRQIFSLSIAGACLRCSSNMA